MKKQHQCQPHEQALELQKLSDARYSLILTIEEVADSSVNVYTQAIEALGLLHQINLFSFRSHLIEYLLAV